MRFAVACLIAVAGCDTVFGIDEVTLDATAPDASEPGDWASIVVGDSHQCGVKLDGSLWCWGANDRGQLGLGPGFAFVPEPQQVGTAKWTAVHTRSSTTCGIQEGGSLYCWGFNYYGQAGNPGLADVQAPLQIPGTWREVAPGVSFTCASDSAGAIWCWGDNTSGQLGVGDASPHTGPVQVIGGTALSHLVAGSSHICGLAEDQTAYCWGTNANGQLGNGTQASATKPTRVSDQRWTTITVGFDHTCARRPDGRLRCWGYNGNGQLGIVSPYQSLSPIKIGDDEDVWIEVAAGARHTCATREDQSLACWGGNDTGQLGGQPSGNSYYPTPVLGGPRRWDTLAAGTQTSCGISTDHNLWCMGRGTNSQSTSVKVPTQVMGSWQHVVASASTTCGIDSAGALYCWGANNVAQLGDETYVNRSSPTKIADPSWSEVTIGVGGSACALQGDGALYCWGTQSYGLGDGTVNRTTPSPIAPTKRFSHIADGWYWTCAIEKGTGQLYCWGYNGTYGLGTGDNVNQPMPTAVTAQQWTDVSGGQQHTCGIGTDGTQCWGVTSFGALGDGALSSYSASPKPLSTTATSVRAGGNHTCAILSGGAAQCWGENGSGQLGNGDVSGTAQPSPVDVMGGGVWSELSSGAAHTCGVTTTGALWCWGNNLAGQLAAEDIISQSVPLQIGADLGWEHVSAGSAHTCATKSDGSLWCWGSNYFGELGIGEGPTFGPTLVP